MQRQSLGSPGRTTSHKDDTVSRSEDSRRRDSSPSSTTSLTGGGTGTDTTDDDEIKPEKPLRCLHHHHNSHHHQSEKFIHLIPLLILISFFILYLSSHDPSPQDMAQFNGFKHPQKLLDSIDIDDIGRIDRNEVLKRGEVLAIRSLRNLQEEIQRDSSSSTNKSRSHRKLGDF